MRLRHRQIVSIPSWCHCWSAYKAPQQDIENQQVRIGEVGQDLAVAQENEQKQYEDMKLRIKYMYENGDASFAEAILTATSYSDLVNKSEYVEKVHGYDRNKLMEYVQTKEEVANLKTELEHERYFNETAFGSRCSFRTSDKKMEP